MENKEALNTLNDIKEMMERSSKFKAISGLSIIIVGILAALVSAYIYFYMGDYNINTPAKWRTTVIITIILLVVAFATVFVMSYLKARRLNLRFTFDTTMRRLLLHFFIPMAAGGLLCIALLTQQHYGLVSSITLIFYGLALINSSHFSYPALRYLGYAELALGLIDCFLIDYALLTWFIGFGVLHIVFGIIFMIQYERSK